MWFSKHKGEFSAPEQVVPFIVIRSAKKFTEQEANSLKEALGTLYFPEEVVIPLIEYYKIKSIKNNDEEDEKIVENINFDESIIDTLTDAIVFFHI